MKQVGRPGGAFGSAGLVFAFPNGQFPTYSPVPCSPARPYSVAWISAARTILIERTNTSPDIALHTAVFALPAFP